MMSRTTLMAFLALLLLSGTAQAQDYIVDQSCVGDPSTSNDILYFSPMGQQFVPEFDRVDVVELRIFQHQGYNVPVPTFAVRIRSESITGPLLGTTRPVVPDSMHYGPLAFEFAESVDLIPGEVYVIELVPVQWGAYWYLSRTHADYPQGISYIWGNPSPTTDLWFREGAFDWVPVEPMTWGRIKALMGAGPPN